ncbi:class I SAM-dependent methyltransferase [Vibrio sp. ZSDZ34]|uniref:Class I SAM-dependent methyltransferase n=1 Tax=Vibrio gelatinilyticus TaxID=2893468 RepID=A0A9X2AYN0_9VIBR|nr:class I SAM-dependent methyltransferase [Vibrio gelatinilyticus]MCJ2376887.1 class I SAM-dependent methyltransferase [Vibrio gelatinilyticus]
MNGFQEHDASFRDSSGFVFTHDGNLYRQVNEVFKDEFDAYINSGLHQALLDKGYVVDHKEVELMGNDTHEAYKILKPNYIPYLTYPYEWTFSQLKDAALLTLNIQLLALEYGFTLKDASAYNVQFFEGKPIFIDTLSFIRYTSGAWTAYRQFCQHFLVPLSLKKWRDYRLGRMAQLYIDGIPLDLASKLLPVRSWFNISTLSHIHLHAKMQAHYGNSTKERVVRAKKIKSNLTKTKLLALVNNLKHSVEGIDWLPRNSEWGNYYENTNYNSLAMDGKLDIVEKFLCSISKDIPLLADIGANAGNFSRLAAKYAKQVVSFDIDEVAVEHNYLAAKANKEISILPVVLDLFNPSPAIGYENKERISFSQRGNFQVIIALALIHHLAIVNNTPLNKIVDMFHSLVTEILIIEFVPKIDSQVKVLLETREDVFPDYHEDGFEEALQGKFTVVKKELVPDSCRTIYILYKD